MLARHYDERLKDVILYGSMARGQAAPVSDIDLLVVLAPPVNYFVELRRLVEILYSHYRKSHYCVPVCLCGNLSAYCQI